MHALLDGGTQVSADKLHGMIKQKVLADSLRISPQNKQEPELLGNASAVLKP
jgi:hypothetical protein